MKIRILATLLALMACALLAVIRAQDINLTGYTLTFDDEFNALSVTTASPKGSSTWYYWPPYGAAGGYSESTWDIASFSVSSGILSDTAFLDSGGNWHSGNLSSMDPTGAGFAQQYGYFEIRCQMPNSGTGAWPAFWLNTQNGIPAVNDPTVNEEVDIFEWYGVTNTSGAEQAVIQQASHNWDTDGSQNESAPYLYAPQTPIPGGAFPWQGYHIYGCQVDPAHITWYIDGIQTNQIATPASYLSSPFYVMVDYALGGGWPLTGMVNDSSLDVDWVRVYSLPTWPVITSATTATGTVGSAFSYQLSALNSPASYNATGLPDGLSINTTTGLISGTPTAAGVFTVTLSATNASGTGTATLTLTVNGIPPPSTVSVNFAGPNPTQPLQATDVAGAPGYTAANWNVFTGANQTTSSLLKDSTGSTAAGMTLSSFASATATLIDAGSNLTPDQKLFAGIIQAYYAGSPAVTISSIPYSSYDVVVYLASDTAGRTGTVSLSGSATTYYYSTEGGGSQPASYVQVTSTTSGNYLTGNYVIFTNLSGPSQTISLTPSNWSGLCGLQIVPTSSELAPVITSNSTAAGTTGGAFNYQITASNGPTSFNATGLPSGLSLNTASGVISGTPAATGTSTVTLSATNAGGTGTATLTLTVNPPAPVITSGTTATGTAGTAFSYTLTASNNPASFNATGLPNGLSVNTTTGVISGTPTAAGTATVTLSATNAGGTGTARLTLTIDPSAPVITSAATATGTAGGAFNYQITAGNSPTSFNAAGLPDGLSVNTTTGVISGTPAGVGVSTVTLSATNAGGTGTATLTLTVNPPAPVITSTATAAGTTGAAFSYTITASNSPASYNATGLPAGLSVNTSTGVISGTPAAIGASTISLTATNAGGTGSATLTLTVTGPLTPATVSVNFAGLNPTQPLQATDVAGAPGYTAANWNVFTGANQTTSSLLKDSTGSTAAGVTLSSFASATATLIDSGSNLTPDQKLFAGIIQAYYAGSPAVTISAIPYSSYNVVVYLASDAAGRTGTVSLSGSATTYYYSTEGGGSQPASYVQVTSTTSGNYLTGNYVVFANQSGASQTISLSPSNWSGLCGLQIVPTAGVSAPVITSSATATGTTGSAFNYQITASNSPTSYSATGLPAGLSVNTSTGAISGTPTAVGISTVTLSATNVGGTGTATLTLTVNPPAPVITSSTAATGTADGAFNYQITATNSPTSYGATGLPAGLSVNTSTGVISGTPTVAGTFTVTLSATNSGGTLTATLTLTVNGALTPATVSVNFAGPSPTQPLQATDVAGAPGYAVANWNVFTGANQTTSSLLQDATGSTAAGVTLSSFASATATLIDSGSNLTPDQKLFAGIIQAYYAGSPAVTISAIPYSSYDVVVYLASDAVGRTGTVSLSGSSTTYYYSTEGGGSQPASYVQVTSTTSGNYMAGNYVVFANQSGSSQTISLTPSNWSGICGLQIVPTAGVSAPVITSSATATGTTGGAFNYQITANNNPTSFNATGLPSGLSVNTTTGAISGTPTIAGIFSVNLSATNAFGTGAGVLVIDVTSSSAAPVINSPLTATGTAGSTLAYRLTATNGPTQYAAASLPAGLTLDPTTGIISGTVATAGTYAISLTASNSSGSGTASLTLTINSATAFAPGPSLTSATSATATVGQAFTYTITASNSPTLYAATSLPSWLSLNAATGVLSGTPTTAETDLIPLTVTNAGGTTSGILTLQVTTNAPAITSATTLSGSVGSYLDYLLTANNAPTSFTATGLPGGLALNASTGEIYGTPTASGTFPVTVTATDSAGASTASGNLTFSIDNGVPVISGSLTVSVTAGAPFYYQVSASDNPSYDADFSSSSNLSGLSIDPLGGSITGTVNTPGSYTIALSATNANGTGTATLNLTVNTTAKPVWNIPLVIYSMANSAYSYALPADSSTTSYSITGLPSGLSLNTTTGLISGTPTTTGTYTLGLSATNAAGTSMAQTLLVVESNTTTVTETQSFQTGVSPNSAYTTASASTDGLYTTANYSGLDYLDVGGNSSEPMRILLGFDVSALPLDAAVSAASLTLSLDGYLSGSDTVNLYQCTGTFDPKTVTWITSPGYNTNLLSSASLSDPSASTITWTSSSASPYYFNSVVQAAIQQDAPLDLVLVDPAAEADSSPGDFNYYEFYDETDSILSHHPQLTVTYATGSPPVIFPGQNVYLIAGNPASYVVNAFLHTGSFNSVNSTQLPPGITFNPTTGIFSGTPTTPGTYPVTVSASNANGTGSVMININIGQTTAFTSTTIPAGLAGSTFTPYTIATTNSSTTPTTYNVDGFIPEGMSFDTNTGILSGTPTIGGVYNITITATDGYGSTSPTAFTITVNNPAPVIGGPLSFNGNQDIPLSAGIAVSNQPTSFSSSGMPSWVTLSNSSGSLTISGTPPTIGTYQFSVTATNETGTSAPAVVTINVAAGSSVPQLSLTGTGGSVGSLFYTYYTVSSWSPALGSSSLIPSVTWTVTNPPPGLTMSAGGDLTGTPTTAGTYNATITVSDSFGSSSASVPITIFPTGPAITSPLSETALINATFAYTITTSDSTSSVTSITLSSLPAGLSFTSYGSGGYITGTPTVAGTYPITITLADANGNTNSATLNLIVSSITSPLTASTQVNQSSFSYTITAIGNPTSFNATNLPSGLSINSTTGVISGTPVAADVVPVTLSATNSAGTTQATLTLTITAQTSDSSASFQQGVAPTSSYTASSVTMVNDSSNPSTLSQTFNTGTVLNVGNTSSSALNRALISFDLSSLPANATITSAALVVNATSANSSGAPLSVEIHQALTNFDPNAANWINNSSYNSSLLASQTLNPASVSGANTFYGTAIFTSTVQQAYGNGQPLNLMLLAPTAESTVQTAGFGASISSDYIGFTTRASDPTQNPRLVITYTIGNPTAAPVITSSLTAPGIIGQSFTYTITATNRPTSFAVDSLPPGLTLNAATGIISGTPTQVGSTQSTLNAINSVGTGTKVVTFNIDNSTSVTNLLVVSGNNQVAYPGAFVAQPLIVSASTSSGPLANALVTFTAKPGQGLLALTSTGTPTMSSVLTVPTNFSGQAAVYLLLPQSYGPVTITATAGTALPVDLVETAVFTLLPDGTDQGEGSGLPILSVLSGEGQSGPAGQVLPQPFVVQALNRLGQPVASLPLTLTVVRGSGGVAGTVDGSFGRSLSLTTNANGQAMIYLEPGGSDGTPNQVSCATAPVLGETPMVYLTALTQSTGVNSVTQGGQSSFQVDQDPQPISGLILTNQNTFPPPDGQGDTLTDYTKVTLNWTPTTATGVMYIIQRRDGDNAQWNTIGSTNGISYQDLDLKAGIDYYYRVCVTQDGIHFLSTAGPVPYNVPLINYLRVNEGGSGGQPAYISDLSYPGGDPLDGFVLGSGESFYIVYNPAVSQTLSATWYFETPYGTIQGAVITGSPAQAATLYYGGSGYLTTGDELGAFDASGSLNVSNAIKQGTVTQYSTVPSATPAGSDLAGIGLNTHASPENIQVTWNATSSFMIEDQNGNPVSSPIMLSSPYGGFTGAISNVYLNATYYIVPNKANVQPGDTITFNYTATVVTNGQTIPFTQGPTQATFVYTPTPPDLSMSLDEAAGPKYRKVALNGLPLPDEKPQATGETDQEQEETYVDALTLGLRHSTTDAYLPVSGSDFSVSARRDFRSQVWSFRNGLRPHEQPDLPFGICWSSNLAPNIQFVQANDPKKTQPDQAIVTDETGAVHTFIIWYQNGGMKFFPMPTAKNEQQTPNLETLTANPGTVPATYTFTRKYGATLTYQSSLAQAVAEDRVLGSQYSVTHSYARLIQAVDRVGNTVNYTFANATNLVPETISVMNQPDTKLSIEQDAHGHVTAIWDAKGNETQFGYTQLSGGDAAAYQLSTVTAPDGAVTHYTYQIDQEPDLMPHASTDPGNVYWHADLASITDPNGNAYQFSYAMDQTKYNYMDTPNVYTGYYPQCGQPRNVTKVTMPDGTSSTWANNSNIRIKSDPASGLPVLFGTRQNQVTDATGFTRTYSFVDAKVFPLPQLKALYNSDSVSDSKIICYQTTQIDYGTRGTPGYQGTEQFTFDPDAAMALSQTTDLSGNVTTFAHADAWTATPDYLAVLTNFAGASLNGFYGDPTSQTDALGGTKTFTYFGADRIMQSVTDENGNRTYYDIDALGRRTSEKRYDPQGGLVQETDFTYGNAAYPGFMTKKCVQALGGPDPGWVRPLVTAYVPDQDGRVAQEITDPGGLALTTTYTYDANGNKLTATDPDGHTTWFSYDTRNRLTTVTHADGSQQHMVYDARGNKIKEWDEDGHATLYAYDALNRVVTQARDMNGNGRIDAGTDLVTSYTYNAVNRKLTTTDPDGHVTASAYDTLQRVTAVTDALGQVTSFVYGANAGGNAFDSSSFKPTQTTDPRGYVTQVTYDALYRPTIKAAQIDPAGAQSVTSAQYDPVGNVILAVDPLGRQTKTCYDALNRPTKVIFADGSTVQSAYTSTGLKWQVTDELGRVTQTQYDAAARAVELIEPLVNNGAGGTANPVTQTRYDAASNVIATINPLGQEWDNAYDARNRRVQALAPAVTDAASGAASRPTTITAYDAVGNVIAKTDPRGNTTTLSYDPANRLLQTVAPAVADGAAGTPTTSQTYDPVGNVLTVTDPNGHTTTNVYDALNRLLTTTDALGITVTNTYDQVGNKLSVTDGNGHTTTFAYDGLNRLLSTTDAAGKATTLAYDALNKIQRTDALGQVTNYFYDVRNRLTGIAYNSGLAANSPRNYSYDLHGNLLSVIEPSKTAANVAYSYDALNRAVTETSNGLTHTYVYDLAGNRLSTVYGGTNRTITSTYDALNRLSTMTESGRVSSYGYDLNGNITQKTLPNGDVETTSFDALNRANLESAQTSGAVSLYSYQYGYDLASNVTGIVETGLSNRTVTNTYDAINRLTQEAVAQAVNVTTAYVYDNANNRTQQVVTGGAGAGTTNYTYNNLNQLTGWTLSGATTSYTYDNNGNRITRVQGGATDTYSYDFENRLIGLVKGTAGGTGTYAYTYDYRTRRIVRDESSAGGNVTDLVFSGGTSVQEYAGTISSANLTVEYIRGSDYGGGVGGILYTLRTVSGTLTPSYTHADKRGDVVAKTSSAGTLTYQAQYQAFGQQVATNGTTLDRQKSNSKDTDPTNLVDEGFRYRDLETGMFISRDPAGMIDGPNEYTYVIQNPWTKFDPEGLETKSQLEDEQKALDEGYEKSKLAINNDKNVSDKDRATGLKSLDEIYNKHKNDIQKRIGKLEQTAKDIARAYGGKPEDYEGGLDDTDKTGQTQELMADLQALGNFGLKDAFLDGMHGDYSDAAVSGVMGMVVNRVTDGTSKLLKSVAGAIKRAAGPVLKTTKEATEAAEKLGFRKTKFVSNGQAVYTDGKTFITRDVDGHNGGVWKQANSAAALGSKKTRFGTYDADLNKIGD